jgi:hypothetical protein
MKRFVPTERERLLFRRQFVLGPNFLNKFSSWQKAKIGDHLFLNAHPDLELTQIKQQGTELTLLGYLIDPDEPEFGNQDILEKLLSQIETPNDILDKTSVLGGRWILILDNGKETMLFNDACGLRQVFYTDCSFPQNWCASQPGIIAEELGLGIDKNAENFINSLYFKHEREYWWPGDSSPFKEIRHLLPNHYLDLRKRICRRYWPNKKLNHISLEEGVEKSSEILKGLMKSASNRFDLAFAITAGWDTRVLLAASKEFSQNIFYYTLIYLDLTDESPDLKIPSNLLPQLGLKHNIIRCPSHMDNEFEEIYKRNVVTAHDTFGSIAQGLYNHYPQNRVCVQGCINSEIAKNSCYYYVLANSKNVNARKLERVFQPDRIIKAMFDNSFRIKHFEKWLSGARQIGERYNINVFDLFGWEQVTGNLRAMMQLEWDIVQEVFSPYNCRALLATLLAVDTKFRKLPRYKLYTKIITSLWREVLSEPCNPISIKRKVRHLVTALLVRTGTYNIARSLSATVKEKLRFSAWS